MQRALSQRVGEPPSSHSAGNWGGGGGSSYLTCEVLGWAANNWAGVYSSLWCVSRPVPWEPRGTSVCPHGNHGTRWHRHQPAGLLGWLGITEKVKRRSLGLMVSGGNESWVKDEDPMAASPAWDPVPSQWGHSKAEEQLCGAS